MTEPDARCGSCSQHEEIGRLAVELTNIHAVHIETIRELARQFEVEVGGWRQKHQEAVGRECGALCVDLDNDRRLLEDELVRLRQEGVPGVVHQTDRDACDQAARDRDRYVELFNKTVVGRRELIGAARSGRYAVQIMAQVETMLAVALGRPGEVYRDQIVSALAELIRERDRLRDGTMQLFDNAQLLDTLVAGIGEATGREATTVNALELFDHLVATYREQARDVKVLEHTDGLDAVTAEARARDAEEKLEHACEENDRLLAAVNSRGAELAAALIDAATERGRVESLTAEANMLTAKLSAAERRIAQLEEDNAGWQQRCQDTETAAVEVERESREIKRRLAGLESAAQATGRQLTQTALIGHKQHQRERVANDLLERAQALIASAEDNKMTLPCLHEHCQSGLHEPDLSNPQIIGQPDWLNAAQDWHRIYNDALRLRFAGPFGRDWLEGYRLWVGTDGQKGRLQLQHTLAECFHVRSWRLTPMEGVDLLDLLDGAAAHAGACHLPAPDEASGGPTEATEPEGRPCGHDDCSGDVPSQPTEVGR